MPTKVQLVKVMIFFSSHIWMWELDHKESWALKNWCFWTMVLETTLESPLDCKETKQVHLKGNQSWIFIGRTDVEAETPILWPPDWKNWLIGKDPDAGKDWRQKDKRTTEDEMVQWHHWLDGHEFEQALGIGDGQVGLASCSQWGHKRVGQDLTTEQQVLYDILILWGFLKRKYLWSIIDLSSFSRMAGIWLLCHLNAEIPDLLLQRDKM